MEAQITNPTAMDQFEAALAGNFEQADCPVEHCFTPGLYRRTTTMRAGNTIVSMQHLTEHPFVILEGKLIVAIVEGDKVVKEIPYEGPCQGVTMPGTKRVLFIVEDTVWVTYHATELTDLDKINEMITAPHDNPLLLDSLKNQWRLQSPQPSLIS